MLSHINELEFREVSKQKSNKANLSNLNTGEGLF